MITTTDRRMQLLDILIERRTVTIELLMLELKVSRSTIKRDLQVLSCSYPIFTTSGHSGGISIAKGYRLGMKYMNEEQYDLLEKLSATLSGYDLATMQGILKTYKRPTVG